jgi:hypothetical protein
MKLVEVGWLLNQSDGNTHGLKFLQAVYNSQNFDLYNTFTIKITVEYLYERYKSQIFRILFPIYILTVVIYLITMYEYERIEDAKDFVLQNKGKRDKNNTLLVAENDERLAKDFGQFEMNIWGGINLVVTLVNIAIVAVKTTKANTYWKSYWGPIDTTFCLVNFLIVIMVFQHRQSNFLRYLEALAAILLAAKSLYFLEMNSKLAPLVYILFEVFADITWFILVILIMFLAFSSAFYLLGQNQIQFDELSGVPNEEGESEVPLYTTPMNSMLFMFYILLGEVGFSGAFESGKKNQAGALWVLFVIATFFFIIVMMNMLVAIMGETFVKNYEIEEQNVLRTKLRFVIDNWYFDPFKGKERTQIQYLVAAILNDGEEEETEAIKELKDIVMDLKMKSKQDSRKIMREIKKIKTSLSS